MSGTAGEKRHPIQVVARRTGLSADVLRAWEKRYGILRPSRSGGGRRLYSDGDVEYLLLLKRAMAAGRSVGSLAGRSSRDLAALVREDEAAASALAGAVAVPADQEAVVDRAVAAVRALEGPTLDALLRRAMVEIDAVRFLERVVAPLLARIGEGWQSGELRPAHEHLASTVARGVLADFIAAFEARNGAPGIVLATPSGERHEFGAMLAAATAAAAGWRVTYLGADLPGEDIAAAARQAGARLVGLSLVNPADDAAVPEQIAALRARLPKGVAIVAGGAGAPTYQRYLREVGARVLPDLGRLRQTLAGVAGEEAGS